MNDNKRQGTSPNPLPETRKSGLLARTEHMAQMARKAAPDGQITHNEQMAHNRLSVSENEPKDVPDDVLVDSSSDVSEDVPSLEIPAFGRTRNISRTPGIPIIRATNLVKNYVSGAEILSILRGISFEVMSGSTVAVSGQSGSGKSTFLNVIGGLDRFDSGIVEVAGSDISGLSEKGLSSYRQRRIGFIFQFHYLLKDFTALENVMIPAFMTGIRKKDALEKARVLLRDMKLDDRTDHFPSQLSGGERQRVAVARAMVNDPDIILADEPTGNLDPRNSAMVTELLYSGAEKWGKTLIVVTHDEKVACRAKIRYTLENGILNLIPAAPGAGGGQSLNPSNLLPAGLRFSSEREPT